MDTLQAEILLTNAAKMFAEINRKQLLTKYKGGVISLHAAKKEYVGYPVERWIKEGKLKAQKNLNTEHFKIKIAELEALKAAHDLPAYLLT